MILGTATSLVVAATPAVAGAVKMILILQMARVLAETHFLDLCDETRCAQRLMGAGFGSASVFSLCNSARFEAWKIMDPLAANLPDWRAYQKLNAPTQLRRYELAEAME